MPESNNMAKIGMSSGGSGKSWIYVLKQVVIGANLCWSFPETQTNAQVMINIYQLSLPLRYNYCGCFELRKGTSNNNTSALKEAWINNRHSCNAALAIRWLNMSRFSIYYSTLLSTNKDSYTEILILLRLITFITAWQCHYLY